MGKIVLKNLPRLRLADLLRRRKMTLRQFADSFGITTFAGLCIHCDRIGVTPPEEAEFNSVFTEPAVNNPQEGVVVLEALPEAKREETVEQVQADAEFVPTDASQKKTRKKKDNLADN